MQNFIEDLSSSKPAPGGGAASAMFSVLGTALTSMVCALTEGKPKYAEHEPVVKEAHEQILALQEKSKQLMDDDKRAFLAISDAYKQANHDAIQKALPLATQVPLDIMKTAAKGLDITESLIGITNKMAVSDLGCAALGFKAAIKGAWLNVYINLQSFDEKPAEYSEEAKEILDTYLTKADKIYNRVENEI